MRFLQNICPKPIFRFSKGGGGSTLIYLQVCTFTFVIKFRLLLSICGFALLVPPQSENASYAPAEELLLYPRCSCPRSVSASACKMLGKMLKVMEFQSLYFYLHFNFAYYTNKALTTKAHDRRAWLWHLWFSYVFHTTKSFQSGVSLLNENLTSFFFYRYEIKLYH